MNNVIVRGKTLTLCAGKIIGQSKEKLLGQETAAAWPQRHATHRTLRGPCATFVTQQMTIAALPGTRSNYLSRITKSIKSYNFKVNMMAIKD